MRPNFSFRKNFLLLFLFLIFNLSAVGGFYSAEATIRYVSHSGSNTYPYTSWLTAADSIMTAINVSVFGDTIYVANGVYEEQVIMIPGLSLIGAGMDSCIIDTRELVTNSQYRAVQVDNDCIIKGFHIIPYYNSDMAYGIYGLANSNITENKVTSGLGGIYSGLNGTVYKNIISGNRVEIYVFNSNALIRKNYIYHDIYEGGSGIHIEAFDNSYKPTVDSNYIETIDRGIVKAFGSNPTITNNTIVLKEGYQGIFLSISDSAKVFNNLIISEIGAEGITNGGTLYLQLYNNYVTGNFYDNGNYWAIDVGPSNSVKNNVVTNAIRGVIAGGTQNLVYKYNNVWNTNIKYSGFTPDSTNLSVDPMIVNEDTTQGELDFHLQKYSPLIDAGDTAMIDKDSSRIDIGLYGGLYGEYNPFYPDLPPRAPRNLNVVSVDSSIITLIWNRNTEADFNHYNLYRDTVSNFEIDTTKFVASIIDTFYLYPTPTGVESLYFKLTGIDNQGNVSSPSEEIGVLVTSVDDEWKPVNNFVLYQNYPNPFNPSTKIGYKLKERSYVKLYIYSVTGELVSVLVNQTQEAGYYEVSFDARYSMLDAGLASGVYIYQIIIRNENNIPVFSDIKKMVYLK